MLFAGLAEAPPPATIGAAPQTAVPEGRSAVPDPPACTENDLITFVGAPASAGAPVPPTVKHAGYDVAMTVPVGETATANDAGASTQPGPEVSGMTRPPYLSGCASPAVGLTA